MAKALFLDRDGVILQDAGYMHRVEQIRLMPGIIDLCRAAAAREFRLVVVTNQSGIARGYFTEADYRVFTGAMLARLAAVGVAVGAVYHCPYHPEAALAAYRREHPWRKPAPGMILAAARELALDLPGSAMIGDSARDIVAARAAGVGTALRIAASGDRDRLEGAPDIACATLAEAADWFARRFPAGT
jgi:D-glycero-D-manno-heptose 1,7-bisphosphate phosphatase